MSQLCVIRLQTIAIDDSGVCQSVCHAASRGCANTAERIEVLLDVRTLEVLKNIVLDGSRDPPRRERGYSGEISPLVQHKNWLTGSRSCFGWRLLGNQGTLDGGS